MQIARGGKTESVQRICSRQFYFEEKRHIIG